jgi:hypothetical protein
MEQTAYYLHAEVMLLALGKLRICRYLSALK